MSGFCHFRALVIFKLLPSMLHFEMFVISSAARNLLFAGRGQTAGFVVAFAPRNDNPEKGLREQLQDDLSGAVCRVQSGPGISLWSA
jgi:hypothetical protein